MNRSWADPSTLGQRAIEDAYAAYIGRLTTVLCEGFATCAASEFEAIVSRFHIGLLDARAAYDAAIKTFEGINA